MALAYKVKTVGDVRNAYKLHCATPTFHKATHNIIAYNAEGESGWCDKGEYGAGHILVGWLDKIKAKDICIIIVRIYGGIHLGTRRFKLMREVAVEAKERLFTGIQ